MRYSIAVLFAPLTLILLLAPPLAGAEEEAFESMLARVDRALKTNPNKVTGFAITSCLKRRNFAIRLYEAGHQARAVRSLRYCIDTLGISPTPPRVVVAQKTGPTLEEIRARAAGEVEQALALTPDLESGLDVYRTCALCHMPEGWGLSNGSVPQLAGQHRKVVIKQLADIRAGARETVLMSPYAKNESLGDTQAIADVAAYIDTLEISVATDKGKGDDLERGARLYAETCASCHGDKGQGNNDAFVPRIQAQHYSYLVRQFEQIRDGHRRNADVGMVVQIEDFEERDTQAVLDYVSRLEPPEEFQAPPGWRNPDFPVPAPAPLPSASR